MPSSTVADCGDHLVLNRPHGGVGVGVGGGGGGSLIPPPIVTNYGGHLVSDRPC